MATKRLYEVLKPGTFQTAKEEIAKKNALLSGKLPVVSLVTERHLTVKPSTKISILQKHW